MTLNNQMSLCMLVLFAAVITVNAGPLPNSRNEDDIVTTISTPEHLLALIGGYILFQTNERLQQIKNICQPFLSDDVLGGLECFVTHMSKKEQELLEPENSESLPSTLSDSITSSSFPDVTTTSTSNSPSTITSKPKTTKKKRTVKRNNPPKPKSTTKKAEPVTTTSKSSTTPLENTPAIISNPSYTPDDVSTISSTITTTKPSTEPTPTSTEPSTVPSSTNTTASTSSSSKSAFSSTEPTPTSITASSMSSSKSTFSSTESPSTMSTVPANYIKRLRLKY